MTKGARNRPPHLLRYRFDSVDQVSRHFHVAAGRVVFFFPTLLQLQPGDPVILEVTFTASEQTCSVQGSVIGTEAGTSIGWWLEFTAHRLVSGLQSAAAAPKRHHRRFPVEVLVNVDRAEGMPVIAKLVDVSTGGARLAGLSLRAAVGDTVRLSTFSNESGRRPLAAAHVSWIRNGEAGLEFRRPQPSERAAIAALVEQARQKLASAYEVSHPAACKCVEGHAVLEPPMPRSVYRQVQSG